MDPKHSIIKELDCISDLQVTIYTLRHQLHEDQVKKPESSHQYIQHYKGTTMYILFAGHYLYIEASAPRRPGQKARILTPIYPATTGECIQFYYHMYGAGMGSLVLHTMANGQITGDIFTKRGNQGNRWILGQATIQSTTSYQVISVSILNTQLLKIHFLGAYMAEILLKGTLNHEH